MGQTLNTLEERWHQHLRSDSNCTLLKNAINKYGKDSFKTGYHRASIQGSLKREEVKAFDKNKKAYSFKYA